MTVDFVRKVLEYLLKPPATAALGSPRYGLPGRVGTKKRRKLIAKLRKEKKNDQPIQERPILVPSAASPVLPISRKLPECRNHGDKS